MPGRFLMPVVVLFVAASAMALNNRSAVSSTGLDTNPCTVASPCRSFSAAIAVTAAGGEVIALDSAGYGPFTIGGAITVSGAPGVHAAITATSGEAAIDISAGSAKVVIRNLVLIGSGALDGIDQGVAGHAYIGYCLIRGFSSFGVELQNGNMTIDHCQMLDSVGAGVVVSNGGVSTNHATITDSVIEGGVEGVWASATVDVAVVRTTISGAASGVLAKNTSFSNFQSIVNVKDSVIVNNTVGVDAEITGGSNNAALIYLSNNLVAYNATAVSIVGPGSAVFTFGNNTFDSNASAGSSMTPISLQ